MPLLDTNILIYGFNSKLPLHAWAWGLIHRSVLGGGATINPVILAEYLVGEQTPETAVTRLNAFGITILELPADVAPRCAEAYSSYLENRRQQSAPTPTKSPLPDFFIGAHSAVLSLPLATADVTRYRTYFPEIKLLSPPDTPTC